MFKETVLEIFRNVKWLTTDVVFTDYCASYKNLRRFLRSGRPYQVRRKETEADLRQKEKQSFYNLLYQLKKQGFIMKRNDKNKKSFWRLTDRGLRHLKNVKRKKGLFSLKAKDGIKNDYLKVIIFDVPENKRKERAWLRHTLVNFCFSMLQKSVWVGEAQLPEDFFNSIKELHLLPHVHIFAVDKEKSGSLFNKI
ncbi:MAG: CRISPR-associated endonuclease Cas2 [Candidatus Paceibacterota bacterium]